VCLAVASEHACIAPRIASFCQLCVLRWHSVDRGGQPDPGGRLECPVDCVRDESGTSQLATVVYTMRAWVLGCVAWLLLLGLNCACHAVAWPCQFSAR
jgi:hypothetical protein